MEDILLVHGAYHNKLCWDKLVPYLNNEGFNVHSINLGGHKGTNESGFKVSIQSQAREVCTKAESIGKPVILLGHSMGGLVITCAGELRPDLFTQLIYLTAIVPKNGECMIRKMYTDMKETGVSEVGFRVNMNKIYRGYVDVDPVKAPDLFYNDCSVDLQREAITQLCLQPIGSTFSKVRWTKQGVGSIKKGYIECSLDNAIPLKVQRQMHGYLDIDRVTTLPSGHSPFLSMPDILAKTVKAMTIE